MGRCLVREQGLCDMGQKRAKYEVPVTMGKLQHTAQYKQKSNDGGKLF